MPWRTIRHCAWTPGCQEKRAALAPVTSPLERWSCFKLWEKEHIWVGPLAFTSGDARSSRSCSCGVFKVLQPLGSVENLQDWSCLLLEAVVATFPFFFLFFSLFFSCVWVFGWWRQRGGPRLSSSSDLTWLPTMSLKRLRQAKTYSDARCSVQKLGLTQMKINNCRQHARWCLHVSNTAELDALGINAWDTGRLRRVGSKMICFSSFTGGPPIIGVEQGGALCPCCPWSVKTKKLNCVSLYVHIQYTQANVSIYR